MSQLTVLCVGDAMIGSDAFAAACTQIIRAERIELRQWLGSDKAELQRQRVLVERGGASAVPLPENVIDAGKDIEVLLAHYAPVSTQMMDCLPRLRIIGIARGGIENVDLSAATKRNILVFNVTGRNAHAVSDFAIGLMLAELRNIARSHQALVQGEWRKNFRSEPHQLEGKHVGIVGLGRIGTLVAQKLQGFEVKLAGYDPYVSEAHFLAARVQSLPLPDLLSASDIVTIHARLSESTRGLIGRGEFAVMKAGAILINTARAGLIDTAALTDALQTGRIAGAALDVFDEEPLPASSALLRLPNVTLTSHIAGTTVEVRERTPYLLCQNIQRFLAGNGRDNLLNPEVAERLGDDHWRALLR
jgi:D-3-phosphoglycerate dehydrogenase / 2-oxoglutarate reductase